MRLFITATNTAVGKTYTTLKLIELAYKSGLKPGVFKPIETGVLRGPDDGNKLFKKCQEYNKEFCHLSVNDIVPYQFKLPAAPYVAKKDKKIELDTILQRALELEQLCDILFIEGAGGLMVPIEIDFFMIDLIKQLKSNALLVTPSRLGSINETLLSQMALKNKNIDFYWYINLYEDKESFFEVTYPFYKDYFKDIPLDLQSIFNRNICSNIS